MNLCDSDRRLIVAAITLLGVLALLGAIILGGLVIVRLHSGDDLPPGVAAYLIAMLGIATNCGSLLAPSPLSKSSGEPQPVTVENTPLEVEQT